MINNQVNTIAREITLIVLGQVKNSDLNKLNVLDVEDLFNLGLQTLLAYWRETLDDCALELETAQQILLESELKSLKAILILFFNILHNPIFIKFNLSFKDFII